MLDEITNSNCETKRPILSDCLLEVNQLTTKWPTVEEQNEGNTLTDVSLTARPGQLLIVVGQVGAGKVKKHIMNIFEFCFELFYMNVEFAVKRDPW